MAKEVDRLMREGQKFRTEATTYKNDYERSQKEIVVLKESTQSMVG